MCPSFKKKDNHAKRHPTCLPHPWGDDSGGGLREMSGGSKEIDVITVSCNSSGERTLDGFLRWGEGGR